MKLLHIQSYWKYLFIGFVFALVQYDLISGGFMLTVFRNAAKMPTHANPQHQYIRRVTNNGSSSSNSDPSTLQSVTSLVWNPVFNPAANCLAFNGEQITQMPACTPSCGELWLCAKSDATSVRERLRLFNGAMTSFRQTTILAKASNRSAEAINRPVELVDVIYRYGADPPYFAALRQQHLGARLQTILFPWKNPDDQMTNTGSDDKNPTTGLMLNKRYYGWTGVKPPCDWWDSTQHFLFDSHHCQPYEHFSANDIIPMEDINKPPLPAMDTTAINKYFRINDEQHSYAFFVHVAYGALVTADGDICVGNTRLGSNLCQSEPRFSAMDIRNAKATDVDEIFVAMQNGWSQFSFYHMMIECFIKMAVLLPFLRDNPAVSIYLPRSQDDRQTADIFRVLGLNVQRIVTGVVQAKVAYWPRPTNCYEAPPLDLQVMAQEYRNYIAQNSPNKTRNSVVYIRRIRDRRFEDNSKTESATEELVNKYGLEFELFPEEPQLSLDEIMFMFYRARVIVAPHGAGLLGMQYSRPGTLVVEAIDNLPNCPCFLYLAHVLGHRYHSVSATGGRKIVKVNVEDFQRSVEFHVKFAAENPDQFMNDSFPDS